MGANGSISMGLSHPDLFCSIGGHSGGYSFDSQRAALKRTDEEDKEQRQPSGRFNMMADTIMRYRDIDIEGFSSMKDRSPKGKIFLTEEEIDKVDPYKLVLEIPADELPHIYIDCGVKDFLYEPTKKFISHLTENKNPFVFGQSEGTHEEDYWGREVSVSMAVQYAVMLRNIWGREFERYDGWEYLRNNEQEGISELYLWFKV